MAGLECYGRWPVLEAIRAGQALRVYIAAGEHGLHGRERRTGRSSGGERQQQDNALAEIVAAAQDAAIPVETVSRHEMDQALPGCHHQGVAADLRPYRYATLDAIAPPVSGEAPGDPAELWPLLLALDGVQDPQNLGNLLRTAEAAGVQGVILPRHHAAEITPAVARAAAGATAYLHVAQVTNLTQALKILQGRGYWVAGLDMTGKILYDKLDAARPLVLVVGGEGAGVSRLVRETCDFLLTLPMHGRVASLNAATAGAIGLYDIRRSQAAAQDNTRKDHP